MESFNLALLAKQWWHIIQNKDSLCYKVLKARYFPKVDPWKIKVSSNPFFLWKSLLEGRNGTELGAVCRVGDGQCIDVWNDPWLIKKSDCKATH